MMREQQLKIKMSRGNSAESKLWSKRKLSTSVHRFWRVGAASTSRQIGCAPWPNIGRAQWVCNDERKMSEKCVKNAWKHQVRLFVFVVFFFCNRPSQAKHEGNPTVNRRFICFFLKANAWQRRRLKSMSQNGFWNIKICKYSGKT